MRWERIAAIFTLGAVTGASLYFGAIEHLEWAKDIALVGVGAIAAIIEPSKLTGE